MELIRRNKKNREIAFNILDSLDLRNIKKDYLEGFNDGYSACHYNRWKPSDEQIHALEDSIEFLGCTKKVREDLKSLHMQLQKLKED